LFLAIEFLDEVVFGVREAAWPSIRVDLGLSYASVGLLLTLPTLVSAVVEPLLALGSGSGRRPAMIAAGGIAFAAALLLAAGAGSFSLLLLAFVILYPASGAFVSLTQATLMDTQPDRHEKNMARWVLAGSVGVVVGPLLFASAVRAGLGWRFLFIVCAAAALPLVARSRLLRAPPAPAGGTFRGSLRTAVAALRNREVLRWLVLLQVTDLLGDVVAGFLALYFVDVVHLSVSGAALTVVVWTVAGLAGDVLLVPLLGRVGGLTHLRLTAVAVMIAYPVLLLVPSLPLKLLLLAAVSLLRAGWYAIPQARLYTELRDDSAVVLALSNIAGLVGGLFPLVIGLAAAQWGLSAAMWLCAAAPLSLLVALPRPRRRRFTRRRQSPGPPVRERR
jgi:FSR family fosmidomycin resistance protein-like MFS transporter